MTRSDTLALATKMRAETAAVQTLQRDPSRATSALMGTGRVGSSLGIRHGDFNIAISAQRFSANAFQLDSLPQSE